MGQERTLRLSCPILLAILLPTGLAASEAELKSQIASVASEVRPDEAMEHMRRIYSTDRFFTFPKFQQTAEYLKQAMTAAGLKNVEIVGAPADGTSQFGFWTMPMAWDARSARLELLEPGTPPEFRVLADYQQVPASLGMWSARTLPQGVTTELIALASEKEADIEKLDLKGKLVLTASNPAGIKWLLARKGALGAVNTFTENPSLENGRQWINAWGDNGWAFTRTSTPLMCFSLSPKLAAYVRGLLAKKPSLQVRATVDTRHYTGVYPYVTGVLPGSGSREEVLALGHTSEQGAQDNATGVSGILEAMSALNRAISAGKLPRPRRSIRMLAMGELYGTMHFLSSNPLRARRTVAALCLDTPAAAYELPGTEYTIYLNPHVAKSYVDAFALRLAGLYFGGIGRPWHWKEYMTGTDTYMGEPMIGIPTVWPYSGSGIQTHHNSEDTPDRVDARSLRDISILTAAFTYYIASAGEAQGAWLAELAQQRGNEQIAAGAKGWLDRVPTAKTGEELGQILYGGLDKIAYSVDRENHAVRSVTRVAPRAPVKAFLANLQQTGEHQSAELRQAVERRAAQLRVKPVRPAPDPRFAAAEKIIVVRKRIGSLPLDDLPPDQREGYPSGAWDSVAQIALFWCDGRRNLAEVIRLTELETGPSKLDFVGYFQFLKRHGYVDFR